jgi:hypothetical protein
MNEQKKTARQARIDTAREGLRSALMRMEKARKGAQGTTSGDAGNKEPETKRRI